MEFWEVVKFLFPPRAKNLDEIWELDMPKELLQLVVYPLKKVMVGCGFVISLPSNIPWHV